MDIFKMKKGDTSPALSATLQYFNSTPIDLTNGSVIFIMGNLGNYSPYISGACTIINATAGQVEYRWNGSETGSVGTYWGEFEMNWTGSRMTLPSDNSFQVQIFEDYN